MPVNRNEESGVLSRQTSNCFAGIPIKKRRFPHIQPPSPPHEEPPPSLPEKNDVKNKQELSSRKEPTPSIHEKNEEKKKEELSSGKEPIPSLGKKNDVKNKEESSSQKEPTPSLAGKNDVKNKEQSSSGKVPVASLAEKDHVKNKEESSSRKEPLPSLPEKNDGKNEDESSSGKEPLLSLPEEYDVKSKEDSTSGKEPSLSANIATDSAHKPDLRNDLLKEVKIETPAVIDFSSVEPSEFSGSRAEETSLATGVESVNNINSKVKPLLTEKIASSTVSGNSVFSTDSVKKQIISNRAEVDCKLEAELSLGSKPQLVSVCGYQRSSESQLPNKIDPSLLSLSLSKENPTSECKIRDSGLTTASVHLGTRRSNWDLNTTMDTWDGSVEDAYIDDTNGIDGLNKPNSASELKPSLSLNSVLGVSVDKGKQVVDLFEKRPSLFISSTWSGQQYKSEDSLQLTLSPSFSDLSASSTKVDSSRISSNSNLQERTTNITSSGSKTVKPEPVDENSRLDSLPFNSSPMGSSDPRLVKREIVEGQSVQAVKTLSGDPHKLVEPRPVKSEVGQEVNQETCSATNVLIHPSVKVVQRQESCSSSSSNTVLVPLTPRLQGSSVLPNSSEFSASGALPEQTEHSFHTGEVHNSEDRMDQPAADMISEPVSDMGRDTYVSDGKVNSGPVEGLNVSNSETSRLEKSGERDLGLHAIAEGSVSDEEKINISVDAVEDDTYGSDFESDGNHSVGGEVDMEIEQCGKEENEYEDGEVREPLVHSSVKNQPFEMMETENIKQADDATKIAPSIGLPGECSTDQIHVDKQNPIEPSENNIHVDKRNPIEPSENNDHAEENISAEINVNDDQLMQDDFSLHKSLSDPTPAAQAEEKRPENGPFDQSGEKDGLETNRQGLSGDGATNINGGVVTAGSEVPGEIVQGFNVVGNADSSLSKAVDTSIDGREAAKQSVTGGNRSRIINLPRASNQTSPSRIRSIPARSLSSRPVRERYSDLDRDSVHLRGKRDDIYADVPNKFTRNRILDHSFRNPRPNFMRGRGRGSSRLANLRGEWEPNHDFSAETFDGPADYRFTRHRRASAITDTGLECDDFVVSADGTAVGDGRGGRKELYSFRHPSSRRISPGARDAPSSRNTEMFRRLPRNIGETGSDLAGLRHEKKFMRGLPDDMTDSIYTRPQANYEELDSQFIRGNRKFSTVQRRGFPRVRSKSPINTRPRSPRQWTSPRRRLTDGFNSLSDQTQHRSPAMYRVDRMRSPDHVGYTEEMGSRRHVSPTYVAHPSNDIREIDSARGHGHMRSINSGRSPSDRAFSRTRRLDIVDPRERVDGDDYFAGPIHAGRFHEFRGDGNSDERKKYGERRSPVRSFRATYSGNNDGYCFNSEDGSRPLRFRSDQDTVIFERNNIRERDFDGLIKSRALITQGRIRNIEEHEGNYRQPEQMWPDDTFNDDSRLKRRRF